MAVIADAHLYTMRARYSQLLGLRGRESYLESQIAAAVEELAQTPLEEGYSQRVQEGKLLILQEAAGQLRQNRGREPEDVQGLVVEWDLLPGALALLQEVGEFDLVIEVATQVLLKWESRAFRRDILLSMALAHCGTASEAFGAKDQVSVGCARMEEALAVLRDAGSPPLAPVLAAEIEESLQELKPHCVLDQLKLPLGLEHAATRKQAISVLKALLAHPEAASRKDGSSAVDAGYVKAALERLTSGELVLLLEWVEVARDSSNIPWMYPGMLETAALAHIVNGFTQRRPALVRAGEKILRPLARTVDFVIERLVAKVLLGSPEAALDLLREADKRDASNSRQRQSTGAAQPYPDYRNGPVAGMGDSARNGGANSADDGSGNGRTRGSSLPAHAEALSFIRANSPEGDADLLPGLCIFTERWLARVAFPRFRDTSDPAASASLVEYYKDTRVTSYLHIHGEESDGMLSSLVVLADDLVAALQRAVSRPLSAVRARMSADHGKAAQLPPLAAASDARAQARTRPPAWPPSEQTLKLGLAFGVLLLGAAVVASQRSIPRPRPPVIGQPAVALATGEQGHRMPWNREAALNARTAEAVIRGWQSAKSAAMGPRHADAQLEKVLADPWLAHVQKDAEIGKQQRWFWDYKLKSLQVLDVDLSTLDTEGKATVTARLEEQGILFNANGMRKDDYCYDNPYTVEYKMVKAHGGWRISNVLVLGDV
ncbi:hypothetical protein WJX72_009142 [[Myrmecia] bisecta]|uniref:ARC6 IMS domain-containing protein n=1 Tax=[Myrmecia] bisecta TaxID=41462 RepID=A0AAW1Q7R6_9CHLO